MTDSAPPEDASPPDPVARPAASRWAKLWGQLKRFRGPIAAIAAFGAVLSGFLGYWSAYQTVQKVVVPQPAPVAVTADAGPLSIVVLPFQNLTGDANQAYVADGLTASLTADFSRIRDAFIVNATDCLRLQGQAGNRATGRQRPRRALRDCRAVSSATVPRFASTPSSPTPPPTRNCGRRVLRVTSPIYLRCKTGSPRLSATASDARWSLWRPVRARLARVARR